MHIGMIPLSGNNLKGTEITWDDFLFLFKTLFSTEENKSAGFVLFSFLNMEKQAFLRFFSYFKFYLSKKD